MILKHQKYDMQFLGPLNVFSCPRLSPTQCLLLHNFLKGGGFAINLKSSVEEWEELRLWNQIWVWIPAHWWFELDFLGTSFPPVMPKVRSVLQDCWGQGVRHTCESAETASRQEHPREEQYIDFRWQWSQRLPSENITWSLWNKFTSIIKMYKF